MAFRYRSYARLLLVLFGLALLLMALGYTVSRRLGGEEAVAGMFWGCGLTFFATAAGGLLPFVERRSEQQRGTLALGSLAVRMGITLLGALVILLGTNAPRSSFLLWVAVSYIVFLIADIAFVLSVDRTQ
jgi:hypothetical protein